MLRGLLCLMLVGCGGDGDGADGGGGGDGGGNHDGAPPADAPPLVDASTGTVLGWVRALESRTVGGEGYESSDVRAFFSLDGVDPGWHVETMRMGDCRLLEYRPGFCDACSGICVAPDVCRPYPTGVDVGSVGLTTPASSYALTFYGFDYVTVPPPPTDYFGAGDRVTASGGGQGGFDAFALETVGVARLESETITGAQLALPNGADFTFRWTAGDAGTRVRLTLRADTQAHGLPSDGVIECEGPDSGSLVVPRALIEAFPNTTGAPICVGVDCPPSVLSRRSRTQSPAGPGDVELVVASEIQFWVSHTAP